jgi:hypothetical protein
MRTAIDMFLSMKTFITTPVKSWLKSNSHWNVP